MFWPGASVTAVQVASAGAPRSGRPGRAKGAPGFGGQLAGRGKRLRVCPAYPGWFYREERLPRLGVSVTAGPAIRVASVGLPRSGKWKPFFESRLAGPARCVGHGRPSRSGQVATVRWTANPFLKSSLAVGQVVIVKRTATPFFESRLAGPARCVGHGRPARPSGSPRSGFLGRAKGAPRFWRPACRPGETAPCLPGIPRPAPPGGAVAPARSGERCPRFWRPACRPGETAPCLPGIPPGRLRREERLPRLGVSVTAGPAIRVASVGRMVNPFLIIGLPPRSAGSPRLGE